MNMAVSAGARRGCPTKASKPIGASSDSLAMRNVRVKSAAESAFNIAWPPSWLVLDSARINASKPAS
ncbi:hypothetical protein D3C80_1877270 [compost metagenome]